jgi:putative ABC transport system substrate-binding protein
MIPIVFAVGSDPVKDGLVTSLARPAGNITGVTFFNNLLAAKRIELLHDLVPDMAIIGLLLNPANANVDVELSDAQAAARAFGLSLIVVRVTTASELEEAFAELGRQRASTLLIAGDAYLNSLRNRIAELSQRYLIASCHANREGVEAGGLASYGANRADADRQFGLYVGRVLKGAKPADLPVMQPTKFEIFINLKTARTLGLKISRELQFRADEVIE